MITRFLFALLSATLLLAGSVFVYPLSAAATATPSPGAGPGSSSGAGVTMTLDEITPWLDDSGTLTVRGTVTNATDATITEPNLRLGMSTRNLDADYRIRAWKSDQSLHRVIADLDVDGPEARQQAAGDSGSSSGSDAAGDPVTSVDATFANQLGPGSTGQFTISVPADDLGLPTSSPTTSWGPRGLVVQLSDSSGMLASGVGFTTWYPNPNFDQTAISLLAPITLTGYSPDGLIGPDELDRAIADDGALTNAVSVLADPTVAIALDPRVIASFEAAVAEPPGEGDGTGGEDTGAPSPPTTPSGTAGPQEPPPEDAPADEADLSDERTANEDQRNRLNSWYRTFLDTASSRTVIALPYSDPDLISLSENDLTDLAAFAQQEKSVVKDVLPNAITDIAWPIAGTADRGDLRALAQAGNSEVILDDVQQPPISGIREDAHSSTRTSADGRSTIETLVSDSTLTNLSAEVIGSRSPAAAMSELVAATAAIQSEAPNRSRNLLLPLPRTTASASWSTTVSTISGLPWVSTAGLDGLLASDTEPRGVLQQSQDQKRIGESTLTGLAETRAREARFNNAFSDPAAANRRLDRALLGCTSVAWTLGGDSSSCLRTATATSEEQMNSVYLEKGSSVLLVTGERTTIPVTIVNNSTAEATLRLRMTPQTPQLRAQTTETVAVPPAETMRVDVPVEGLANADVPTTIEMVAADGTVLPKNTSLLVRVRADWENIGTAVVGLVLAAVFVIGLVKSVSRGRRKIPEQQLAAAVARAKNSEPEKKR